MSNVYGYAGSGGMAPSPPGKVNFGWIGEAWNLFMANAVPWIVAVLVMALVPALVGFIIGIVIGGSAASTGGGYPSAGTSPFARSPLLGGGLPLGANLTIQIFSLVWRAFFSGGVYRMAVKQVRGEPISVSDVFSGGPLFLNMLLLNLVYGLGVGIGTLLCIIPGLLVAGLLFPAFALIADGDSLSTALTRSSNAMKQDMWSAAGFIFVMGLLVLVSAIPCGLGLLATYPMFWLISALAYRDMVGMPNLPGMGQPAYGEAQPGVWPPPPGAGLPPAAPPPGNWPPPAS